MKIKSLKLKDFRNYDNLEISFCDQTNIIYGDNAQGKTNILEAIYVSGTTRSHKSAKDREMIRFDCDEAHISTIVEKQEKDHRIDIHLKKSRSKGIAVDQIPIKKASDLFGLLNIIFFSPEDLNIIKDGPSERRRFMDSELCQLDRIYLHHLSEYQKVLNQRNKLLKDIYYEPALRDTLSVWDEKLIEYAKEVIRRRKRFIEEIAPIVENIHGEISGGKETLKIAYEPNTDDAFMADELIRAREHDLRMAQTSVGPHRDDIDFEIESKDVRKYGSQGQQRTAALSLKLSEIILAEKELNERPVLLLDDVMSELDKDRQNYLLSSIKNTQTIITCTGLDEFVKNRFEIDKVFRIVDGALASEE